MSEPINLFLIRMKKEQSEAEKLIMLTNKYMENYKEDDQKIVKTFINILQDYSDKLREELTKFFDGKR